MKRFITTVVLLFIFMLGGAVLMVPASTGASGTCDAHGVGNKTMTKYTSGNSAYVVASGKATVTFNVVGKNCNLPVTMIAWKAPNGTTGKPYAQQTMFAHVTKNFSEGRHSLTVELPSCYYQVDTVTGTKLTGSTGGAHDYNSRQVGFIHGGTKSCVVKPVPTPPPPPTPTPTPTAQPIQVCDLTTGAMVTINQDQFDDQLYTKDSVDCTTRAAEVTPVETPEDLPDTGPGQVFAVFAAVVAIAAVSHQLFQRRLIRR